MSKPRALIPLAITLTLALSACGTSSVLHGSRSAPAAPANGVVSPPKTVTADPLRPAAAGGLRPGTPVSAHFTGIRVLINRHNGFAITDLGPGGGTTPGGGTYPVATTDGGKTWRTDGPVLHVPAAQGPLAVGQAGVAAPRIYFAWCAACNNLIDITTDAGKHWWAARLPGPILSLVGTPSSRAGLTAVVEGPTSDPRGRGASLWVYISHDGRRWTYSSSMSAVS